MSGVQLHDVAKRYNVLTIVDKLNLDVASGEMVALLGPSGCGKTTTLRMVAGFVKPTAGRIDIGGNEVTRVPSYQRNIGLVFQNYALFPHLTVGENIAFGLRRRRIPKADIILRVSEIIGLTRLEGLENRFPKQLSGGQQQRVAVARALVIRPAVLLLDEPFSNLDAKLRESTSHELRRIQLKLGITSIFVTHDQQEAMSIADRVAVMNAGRIEQIGTGPELYRRPASRFVASFLGKANFIDVTIRQVSGATAEISFGGVRMPVPVRSTMIEVGSNATLMVRPEFIDILPQGSGVPATVIDTVFQGAFTQLRLALPDQSILSVEVAGKTHERWVPGSAVICQIDSASCVLLGADGAAL